MDRNDVVLWLETVHGGLDGWIDLRAIDPEQKQPPQSVLVGTVEEAAAWCARSDERGTNLYAGLVRRGEQRDEKGQLVRRESNLLGGQVLWVDLDEGTREECEARLAQLPVQPTLTIDSGGGMHALWKLEEPIDCVAEPPWPERMRHVLRGLQDALGGDPAVTDPTRIFRIAGTTNYPNARKRLRGREPRRSCILASQPYCASFEDFEDFELRGKTLSSERPQPVAGTGETLPPSVEAVLSRVPRMRAVFDCEQRLRDKTPSDEDFAIAAGLLKHAPWLRTAEVEQAIRYRRIALAHLVKGSQKSDSYFRSTAEKAKQAAFRDDREPDFEVSPARWYQWVVRRALLPRSKPTLVEEAEHRELPHLATSSEVLDERLGGGFYGFTMLAGESGVGKSTLAWNSALIGVRAGWTVVYLAAEMDPQEYEVRAARFLGCTVEEARPQMPHFFEVSDGIETDALVDVLLTTPTDETPHLLVVLDSLTKVARFAADPKDPRGFFVTLSQVERLCEGLVRFGKRRITVVATSELNKEREVLGRSGIYSASLQVSLSTDRDNPGIVYAKVDKGRASGRTKKLGPFWPNWRTHRLDYLDTSGRGDDRPGPGVYDA